MRSITDSSTCIQEARDSSTKKGLSPFRHIVLPKLGASESRCMVLEGPSSARNGDISMDLGDTFELPAIIIFDKSTDDASRSTSVEIRRQKRGDIFFLKGEENNKNFVSLVLRIADQGGHDTIVSISSEMVEQLELADQNVKFIAELIDLLLMNLIADWKPCVAFDHLVSLINKQTRVSQQGELELAKCTGSSKNSTEDLGPSTSFAILAIKGNLDNIDIDGALCDECNGLQKATKADDHSSEKSYASATTDFNDNKFSTVSFMSAKSEFDGGSKSSPASEIEASFDRKSKYQFRFL
ncbi:serine/threonine-protein kinase [Vigna angularis]|uniref:Serine/threonine-protein kinase n=1 Tax=Phaseolus angularis TaxID=3914 RepID=A0A8T0JVP1_PHAAN|nr:serine/threonine-protein kinase [Vigna angularis]